MFKKVSGITELILSTGAGIEKSCVIAVSEIHYTHTFCRTEVFPSHFTWTTTFTAFGNCGGKKRKDLEILRSKKPESLQYFSQRLTAPQMACASSNKNKVKREGGGKLEGTIFNSSLFQKIIAHPGTS